MVIGYKKRDLAAGTSMAEEGGTPPSDFVELVTGQAVAEHCITAWPLPPILGSYGRPWADLIEYFLSISSSAPVIQPSLSAYMQKKKPDDHRFFLIKTEWNKIHIFWEGHKILWNLNLPLTFNCMYSSQE